MYLVRGRYGEAEVQFRRALAIRERTLAPEHPDVAQVLSKLGAVYEAMDDPQNALQKYTDTLNRNPRFFEAYRELGGLYLDYNFKRIYGGLGITS